MKKISKHFVLPSTNIESMVNRVAGLLNGPEEIVELKGFPIRIFCFKNPDYIGQVLKSPQIGSTKSPKIMPRVMWTMKAGAYIKVGGEEWVTRRQQVQTAFAPAKIDSYSALLPQIVARYTDRWTQLADQNKTFDLFKDLRLLITEFNYQMLFSKTLTDAELAQTEAATFYVDQNFVSPIPLWLPTPGTVKFKKSVRQIYASFQRIIDERNTNPSNEHDDVLAHLMKIPLEGDALLGELASIYFGASVMSTSIAWAFYLSGLNTKASDKLSSEAVKSFNPLQTDRASLNQLEYSKATIKETLRLYPPSFGYPRYSANEFEMNGYKIPAGSLLIPMVYLAHRDSSNFKNPLNFEPERFLPTGQKVIPNSYLPFGLGPRSCLGAALAPYIMQTCILGIAKELKFQVTNRVEAEFGFEIHPKTPIYVRATKTTKPPEVKIDSQLEILQ